ncbi:MAG: TonB-dependent receptor [Defluviicoccus sp.]|nr:TonB-dependent receptor [Defluviicoccus sp.]
MTRLWTGLALISLIALIAAAPANAGSLAPAPRVIVKFERDLLEGSGSQNLQELLDTGIIRYLLTGGQALPVLVNGTPYASTASDLDSLPLAAMERIELLGGESLGTFGGSTVRNALNVVLREDWDGVALRALARLPSRKGGDGWQGNVSWGGKVGQGHLTVTADSFRRLPIGSDERDYSRGKWQPGGSFADASNISLGGNTVRIVKLDDEGNLAGFRSVALGDCDPAKGYTGPLSDPPGPPVPEGDKGCGFNYSRIMWETLKVEQQNLLVNARHPLGESAEMGIVANLSRYDTDFLYAPSVGGFRFVPDAALRDAINEAGGPDTADDNDAFFAIHRFVGHGNRHWRTESEAYDVVVGVEGRLTSWLGYDAKLNLFRQDATVEGNTFVHGGKAAEQILAGNYDLRNPFSQTPRHRQAIVASSLRHETDARAESRSLRAALEGSGFSIGGRKAAWTAGVELSQSDAHSLLRFVDRDGVAHGVSEVLGAGGASFAGERESMGAFAETLLPVTERLDLRFAGRADDYDDVGTLRSWRAGAEYRPIDTVAVRSSWSEGELPPSLHALHSTATQSWPYIECDPGPGAAPRTCPEINGLQVERNTEGNPDLEPVTANRLAVEAAFDKAPYRFSVEWFREARTGRPGNQAADWAVRNLPECAEGMTSNCIRWEGDLSIHDRLANVVNEETKGITARFGTGFATSWGWLGAYGTWRREFDTDRTVAGVQTRVVRPKDMMRARFFARRANVRAVWTASHRSGFKNAQGSGSFDPWTGHDLRVDWTNPIGLDGVRITGGVFNVTDAGYTIDTANPTSIDGPTVAGWGRTFFLALSAGF